MLSKVLAGRTAIRTSQLIVRGMRAVTIPLTSSLPSWERMRVTHPPTFSFGSTTTCLGRPFTTNTVSEQNLFEQKLGVVSSFERAIDLITVRIKYWSH